jgi:hypothetical protein
MIRRTSSKILAAALVIAALALASTLYRAKLRRDFAPPTAIAIGKVIRPGALLGRSRRSQSKWFCWVEYQFTPPGGALQQGWRFWGDYGCDVKRDADIPIQYVIGKPDMHRPVGAVPPGPPLLLWFAAGVVTVIAVIRRGSDSAHL